MCLAATTGSATFSNCNNRFFFCYSSSLHVPHSVNCGDCEKDGVFHQYAHEATSPRICDTSGYWTPEEAVGQSNWTFSVGCGCVCACMRSWVGKVQRIEWFGWFIQANVRPHNGQLPVSINSSQLIVIHQAKKKAKKKATKSWLRFPIL